ncbi:hypothetical protein CG50_10730 [Paenirhodobacter enshiensis]|uniref:Uncharacterized protein n=2 Tax=Paenirhodobacter enshiensis TaxID=1105367 RepID=A0A086XQL9_9RHOB|nr:hypothetical protein CG50_10730 [Paenirhodobacter enshiensis]
MPGDITMTTDELEDMLDRAARRGAKAALAELGLHDAQAATDINDMRSLIAAWREARSTAWQTMVRLGTTALFAMIATAVWLHLKGQILK